MSKTASYPMSIRRLTEADLSFAFEIQRSALWNQIKEDWRSYMEFDPEGCFLASVHGEKAGTATTISYDRRFGWVGMVLVHPSKRRLGVGSALLNHAIRYVQDSGIECIKLDATPMGREVYIPLGFRDEYGLNRYEGTAIPKELRPFDQGVILPFSEAEINEIAGYDEVFFGAGRPQVLSRLCRRGKGLCFYVKNGNTLSGYIMARDGTDAYQIGPWVANDSVTAEILLQAVFAKIERRKVFLDVPDPNEEARRLIESYSFTVQRPFARMYLGPNQHPGLPEKIFSTSGAEKG